jgi:hypothetical protein
MVNLKLVVGPVVVMELEVVVVEEVEEEVEAHNKRLSFDLFRNSYLVHNNHKTI